MTTNRLPGSARRAATAAAIAALAAAPALADDARPTLDERFTDTTGDLLADVPEDESEWLDPSTIVFTYTPVEDPALYQEVWDDFIRHMEEVTGRDVTYFTVDSYAAMVEAMRAGRLHVGGFATGSVPLAVNCAGFHPYVTMSRDGAISGYEMEIITYPGSGIDSMDDLPGRQLAFVTESSNSGFRAPSALLASEFGLDVETDVETTFSGAHDNSILGVANQDYEAAAIANSVKGRMLDREVISEDQIEVIYQSATFPTTSYGHAHNLHPDLQEAVREAFMTFEWAGDLAEEFADEDGFIEISYADDWQIIRDIAAQTGDSFSCS